MRRRFWVPAVVCLLLCDAAARSEQSITDQEPSGQPHYTVSAEQLQRAVAQRFPLRYPVQGLMTLEVQTPLLRLLPERNRVSAEMTVDAAGPALQQHQQGTLEVDFMLRYEASDRTLRAYQLRLGRLQFPGLQPGVAALINTYGPALAEKSLLEVVLHQLRPQDLAMTDVMGLQPGSITVTQDGLVIGFVMKPK